MDIGDGLFLVLPFLQAMLGVAFVLVARLGSRTARFWGAGYLVNAAAQAVPLALAFAPYEVQAVIACTLFVASFTFFALALRCRFCIALHRNAHALFAALASVAAAVAFVGFQSLRYELLINDLTCSLPIFAALCAVATRTDRSKMDRVLFWMSAAIITDTTGRSLWFFANTAPDADAAAFLVSPYLVLMQISATVTGLLYALTALAAEVLEILSQYRDRAERDPLTGLLNRRGFDRAVPSFPAPRLDGVVLTCDIDRFKRVNDRHGHAMGDRVIVALAESLKKEMPVGSISARFGGEEFVTFATGLDLDTAKAFANAVRRDFLARTGALVGLNGAVTVSFGVAPIDGEAPLMAAIARADTSLLQAKAEGRDRVVCLAASPVAGCPVAPLVHAA